MSVGDVRIKSKVAVLLYETVTCMSILFFKVQEKPLQMQWLGSTEKKDQERREEKSSKYVKNSN